MAKRISVQGRGLGAYFPEENTTVTPAESSIEAPREDDSPIEENTRISVSEQSTSSRRIRKHAPLTTIYDAVSARISELPYINAAFRFSRKELNTLEECVHEIKRIHGAKITKQDIVRLGLASILEDHERNGDESLLGQYAKTIKRAS